jgi:hypothetical protein
MKRLCALIALLAGMVPMGTTAQTGLGRLFFTPAERAELDRQPRTGAAPAHSAPRVLNGVVRRSDGSATVWIDGQPQTRRLVGTERIPVATPDGQTHRLRVGESTAEDTPPADGGGQ